MFRLATAALICLQLALLASVRHAAAQSAAGSARPAPAPAVPNLSGTWRLDRDLSTADLSRIKTTVLVVRQSYDDIRFDYYDGKRWLGAEQFLTDGTERPRYKTRIERAYARAAWKGDKLVVRTRSFLDVYGYQSYELTDTWERSDGGQTLINKSSDGKAIVYYRIDVVPRAP